MPKMYDVPLKGFRLEDVDGKMRVTLCDDRGIVKDDTTLTREDVAEVCAAMFVLLVRDPSLLDQKIQEFVKNMRAQVAQQGG